MKRVASDALVLPGAASTPFSGWSKAKAALDGAVADARGASLAPWSVHDLRRTVATGLQRLGVRLEVTEAVLNHISGSRAGPFHYPAKLDPTPTSERDAPPLAR